MVVEEDMWVESDPWGNPTFRFSRKKSVIPRFHSHEERYEPYEDHYDYYSDAETIASSPEWCD